MMLMDVNNCALLVVDIQEKLAPLCDKTIPWIENCVWLTQIAKEMAVPIVLTEQYPRGLGKTLQQLQGSIGDLSSYEKLHFSCAADASCNRYIEQLNKQQLILIGIEAHVCILQTALHYAEKGKDVFVVADAISSRSLYDKKFALKRLLAANVHLVTKEMVVFEWLREAGTEKFKDISKRYLR